MLDNVVEINGLPLEQQRHEIHYKRRHGMGFLGLGSTLTLLRMKYGSPESLEFTERVAREMAEVGWKIGIDLASEKGPAPIMTDEFAVTEAMLVRRPEMRRDGYKVGDKVPGRVLLARYSRYMQQFDTQLTERIAQGGCRFTHHSSIAPTGTISLSLANNASNGIEPSFAHKYSRNVIRPGRKTKEKVDVFSYELLAYRILVNPEAGPDAADPENRLPDYFISADDIKPRQHVDVQAAAQKWIDSSISKTANVPTDFPYEDFKDIYLYAYEKGPQGLHHLPLQPGGVPGRAGEGQGSREHHLPLPTRKRRAGRGSGQRRGRVRRRDAHCRQSLRCPEGRVLRKVLIVEYESGDHYRFGHTAFKRNDHDHQD